MQQKKRWEPRLLLILGASLGALLLGVMVRGGNQVASANPQQAILNQTVCSFIVTRNVGGRVFVRQGPGTNYPVVGMLKRGDGVRATLRQGNWVQITARSFGYPPHETYQALNGWVNNRFINGCSEDEFERWRQ